MKQKVYNLIILDESGSMQMIAKQAVSGLNETLQSIVAAQKEHEDQEQYVSFVTFNSTRIHTVMNRQKVDVDKEIKWDDFSPNSCTPLFDAMGLSICELRNNVGNDDVILVTIITDGMENASKEYDGMAIKRLVSDLKEKGWVEEALSIQILELQTCFVMRETEGETSMESLQVMEKPYSVMILISLKMIGKKSRKIKRSKQRKNSKNAMRVKRHLDSLEKSKN